MAAAAPAQELAADTEMLEDVCDNEKDAGHYPRH